MAKYNVPKRKYCVGKKKMVSLRLHEALVKEVEALAEEKGWTVTDLVSTVLDQFVQFEEKKSK
jgi:antitoxin component of RelBE/YafQ-DinJ toxin-antitoxin module